MPFTASRCKILRRFVSPLLAVRGVSLASLSPRSVRVCFLVFMMITGGVFSLSVRPSPSGGRPLSPRFLTATHLRRGTAVLVIYFYCFSYSSLLGGKPSKYPCILWGALSSRVTEPVDRPSGSSEESGPSSLDVFVFSASVLYLWSGSGSCRPRVYVAGVSGHLPHSALINGDISCHLV